MKDLGLIISERADKESVVSSFGLLQGLPFYTKRRVVVVGDPGEAEFGSSQGDNSAWFMDQQRFVHLWDSPRQVFTVLSKGELAMLQGVLRTTPRILGDTGKNILVTNR